MTTSRVHGEYTVDEMFYEFHKESLVGGGGGERLRNPGHVIKNTGKFMER